MNDFNYCEVGKHYSFFGVPLAFRGVVEKETMFAIFLKAGTVERLQDSESFRQDADFLSPGEKLKNRVIIEKNSGLVIVEKA